MSVRATELRKGNVIAKDGDLLLITDYEHRTPGNLRAIVNIKTKSLLTGATNSQRLASGDTLDLAYLERKKAQYLYKDSAGYVFMDNDTYDQFTLTDDVAADAMGFVRENSTIEVTFHEGTAIGVDLPPMVVLTVAEAEQAVKGNTASNVKKEAIMETGLKVKVPMHIDAGEEIKISTDTGEFQGRAN